MTSAGPGLGIELVRRDLDECVLAVSGELSLPSPVLLTRSLSKALADPGRVLVDVSGLRPAARAAVRCSRRCWPVRVAGPEHGWCCSEPAPIWPERSPRCG
jgi:hypothetical protein